MLDETMLLTISDYAPPIHRLWRVLYYVDVKKLIRVHLGRLVYR